MGGIPRLWLCVCGHRVNTSDNHKAHRKEYTRFCLTMLYVYLSEYNSDIMLEGRERTRIYTSLVNLFISDCQPGYSGVTVLQGAQFDATSPVSQWN